ncbi:hypothetical protein P872_00385 [Rhodonellum psychrophilum GCM71 = DSM 17998]|uniref:Uncharacterized protein n=1 Tax=Rhodonellum psychrophilum GCM71 = DSM 17998 TaxID=1123057 RepID=U5C3R7_9BACT|nr:hypothetical protein P872_00385 [Rhodonellum psychrophilum GCM71 = DSM 17998]
MIKEQFTSNESQKITDRDSDISRFKTQEIEVKFVSIDGLETERIHYVRLLKAD